MAITSIGSLGSAQSKSSGTTLVITTSAAAEVGNLVHVSTVWDNTDTSVGDTSRLSISDSGGNTWTKLKEHTRSEGAAEDGVTVAEWVCVVTTQIASGGSITVTSDTARVAKAANAWEFDIGASSVEVAGTLQVAQADSDPASQSISGLSSVETLWLHVMGMQRPDGTSYTQDSDLTTSLTAIGTTGGGSITNVMLRGGFLISTATGITVDVATGLAGDHVQFLVAIREVSSESHSGSSTVSGGGAAATQGQKDGKSASVASSGGAATGVGKKGGLSASACSSGGAATANGLKGGRGSSSATGGGFVVCLGSSLEAHSGACSVRGGGGATSSGTKGGRSLSAVSGGGQVQAAGLRGAIVATSVSGGGAVVTTGRSARFSTVLVSGGGAVIVVASSASPGAPPVTSRTRTSPASGRTSTGPGPGRTRADGGSGKTQTDLED